MLVELSGLTAASNEDGAVVISWQTALETDHDGFHVYRASVGEGDPTRRTDRMIRGRSPYSWIDREVNVKRKYTYAVTAVDRSVRGNESEMSRTAEVVYILK